MLSFTSWPAPLQAQSETTAKFGRIYGIVTDDSGAPISNAEATIVENRRVVRSRADGTFRFDSVQNGHYSVRVRAIQYVVQSQVAVLGDSSVRLNFKLQQTARLLESFGISANAIGLSGLVHDVALKPLANSRVLVIGSGLNGSTDQNGKFFLPAAPGSYLVVVQRDGYESQSIGVTIPQTEIRQIAVGLNEKLGDKEHASAQQMFDLGQRVLRASPASTHFFSREDLIELGITDLAQLARTWADGTVTADCTAQLGGSRASAPVTSLLTNDIEYVELYLPSKVMLDIDRGVTSINGNQRKYVPKVAARPGPVPSCGNLALIVWQSR